MSIARLADLSLLHGDLRLAELCLQRARSYARLSFLYTLTGQADKLGKLVRRWMVFMVIISYTLGEDIPRAG